MLSLDAPDFPFGLLFILPESSIRNMTFGLILPLPPLVTAWLSSTNGASAILAPAYRGKSAKAKSVCLVKGLMLFDIFESAWCGFFAKGSSNVLNQADWIREGTGV